MRTRLIASFALIIIVTIVAVGYFARQGAIKEVDTFVRRGGLAGLSGLATSLESHYEQTGSWDGADEVLETFGESLTGSKGQHGPGGQHGTGPGMGDNMSMTSSIVLADSEGNPLAGSGEFDLDQPFSAEEMEFGIPLIVGGKTVGLLMSETFMSMPPGNFQTELGERLSSAALNATLVAGGIAIVLASVLAYYSIQPIRKLTQAAAGLGRGEMDQRVEVKGGGELAALGETFNSMADGLEKADQRRKAMTADIAHELRNPLAVQLANLEALEDGVYPLTAENLAPIMEQNRLLTRLVEDLHTLTLSDEEKLKLQKQSTDMIELLQQVVSIHQSQAQARSVALSIESSQTDCPTILVDGDRIGQILSNLIQNALRYVPEGGWVKLIPACGADHFTVQVHDNGPGIDEADVERIFERFHRSDAARSREQGGSGLGLTIARRLAEAHGGTLTAANHTEGGAVFTLTLPRDNAEGD